MSMAIELMQGDLTPSDALKMLEELESGIEPEPDPKTEAAPPAASEAPAAAKEAEAPPEPEVEQEPQGIATKDGKHVIPYSVLQSERNRAAAAERELQATLAKIAELEARQTDPKPAANNGAAAPTEEQLAELDPETLAELEQDFPTIVALHKIAESKNKALQAQIEALKAKLDPLENLTRQEQANREQQRAQTVQEAIDAVPKLAHVQASDPDAFAMAQQFDSTLRERPEWADKPLSERFAKVVELVEAARGEIQLKQPAASSEPANLKQAAAAKLKDSAEKAVPTSLSQFPAGEPVATDEASAIAALSHAQIAEKFARMTPAQMDAYLNNF
jgi:hypothetical protein